MARKTLTTAFVLILVLVPLWILSFTGDFEDLEVNIQGYAKANAANDIDLSIF